MRRWVDYVLLLAILAALGYIGLWNGREAKVLHVRGIGAGIEPGK